MTTKQRKDSIRVLMITMQLLRSKTLLEAVDNAVQALKEEPMMLRNPKSISEYDDGINHGVDLTEELETVLTKYKKYLGINDAYAMAEKVIGYILEEAKKDVWKNPGKTF